MMKGTVIKSTGSWYNVRTDKGKIYTCRIIGKFRLQGFKLTNPVAVGDHVKIEIETEEEDLALIKEILPRKNYVVRQSPRKKHYLHLLAANIDQAILIVTMSHPKLKIGFIDRFLMMTEPHDIPVTIIFNKKDIYKEKDLQRLQVLHRMYSEIGYHTMEMSAFEQGDIEKLRKILQGKVSLMSGQSGVGKSTIIEQLIDEVELRTADLSEQSGKGQHTTTFAEMFPMNDESYIVDTPGIKTLAFNNYEVMDVAHNFREFFKASTECKFSNCTHRNEPKCAVKKGVEEGEISPIRYENYLQIVAEIEGQNYWERLDF